MLLTGTTASTESSKFLLVRFCNVSDVYAEILKATEDSFDGELLEAFELLFNLLQFPIFILYGYEIMLQNVAGHE